MIETKVVSPKPKAQEAVATSAPARPPATPDVWQSLRDEIDRVFDRFTEGFLPAAWRPGNPLETFDRLADNFWLPSFRRLFNENPVLRRSKSFIFNVPAIDLSEDDDGYKITAELPGLDEKDVEVSVSEGTLTIKGEKQEEKEESSKNRHMTERYFGSFQRSLGLPAGIDQSAIAANFAKGVLTIKLPKTAESKTATKKIEIKSA